MKLRQASGVMAVLLRLAVGRVAGFERSAASAGEVDDRSDDEGHDDDPAENPEGGASSVVGCCELRESGRCRVCDQGFKHATSVPNRAPAVVTVRIISHCTRWRRGAGERRPATTIVVAGGHPVSDAIRAEGGVRSLE
jgi:hypothetical protein